MKSGAIVSVTCNVDCDGSCVEPGDARSMIGCAIPGLRSASSGLRLLGRRLRGDSRRVFVKDIHVPIEINTPPQSYPPVGYCIYCTTDKSRLEKEHIIPFGLAGNSLVLPKSSCRACAEITRDFETFCMRHMWWPFRTAIGAPTRKGKRPTTFTLRKIKVTDASDPTAIKFDQMDASELEAAEYPISYIALAFPPPGILVGRDPLADIQYKVWVTGTNPSRYAKNDKDGFLIAPVDPVKYCQLLAKIAHAYTSAKFNQIGFKPTLRETILGKEAGLTSILRWVGGSLENPPAPPDEKLHELSMEIDDDLGCIIVNLRLFCFLGSPQYQIVSGYI